MFRITFEQEHSSSWDGRPCQSSGPKSGGCYTHFCGELGPHLTQCGKDRGLHPYQVAS